MAGIPNLPVKKPGFVWCLHELPLDQARRAGQAQAAWERLVQEGDPKQVEAVSIAATMLFLTAATLASFEAENKIELVRKTHTELPLNIDRVDGAMVAPCVPYLENLGMSQAVPYLAMPK